MYAIFFGAGIHPVALVRLENKVSYVCVRLSI
jgi:hypothetical protein